MTRWDLRHGDLKMSEPHTLGAYRCGVAWLRGVQASEVTEAHEA